MGRPVSRHALAVTFALALWVGLAAEAHADDDVTRIEYRAPTECPNAANFIAEVSARTHRAHLSDTATNADRAARTITVSVAADGAAYRGTLRIARAETVTSERAVTGDTCVEVVSALALIAVLELDPGASTAALPAANPAATAPVPAPSPMPVVPAVVAQPPPVMAFVPLVPTHRESSSEGRVRFSAGLDGDVTVGLVPGALVGGDAFAELFAPLRGWPSVRLSAGVVTGHPTFVGAVGARVTLSVARVEACPWALRAELFELRFCATLDGGIVSTRGSGVEHPANVTKPWFAPGLRSRASWTAPNGVFGELGAGLAVPFARYPFEYEVNGIDRPFEAYRVSFIGATLSAGIGYHFP